jgi:hypothetical protein
VRRGITTGANDFFYLSVVEDLGKELLKCSNNAGWEGLIERKYLVPAMKSPKESSSLFVDPAKAKVVIFSCNESKEDLAGTTDLSYIDWGEHHEVEIGKKKLKGYHQTQTVKARKRWWALGEIVPAKYNFNYLISTVGKTYLGNILVSDNFHEIHTKENAGVYLNSTIFFLFQNVIGRANFGGGVMKIQTYELKSLPYIETDCSDDEVKGIDSVTDIFKELGLDAESDVPFESQEPKPLQHRAKLDEMIFDELGLTSEDRKDVYRGVCRLIWNRLNKAKSV